MPTQGGPWSKLMLVPGPPLHPAHHGAGASEFPWLTAETAHHWSL